MNLFQRMHQNLQTNHFESNCTNKYSHQVPQVAMQQDIRLSNLFPLFCLDNVCKPTPSRVSSNTQQRSHKDTPTVEEMLGINEHIQDKLMSGQHSAQNGNVVLDISKVRDVDSRQQKH